jgi:RsiW-degrading membrane proteinase PrsW (M82 family)
LKTAPALRQSGPCRVLDVGLVGVLILATLLHFSLFSRMSAEVAGVFVQALVYSSALSVVPLAIIWFLDRRERENPWLLAGAFLWGGCIATALSLPVNSAFFLVVDRWVALNPMVTEILGPDATLLIAAPLSAPIVEEITKAAGVALIFWLLRDEFDNMRDGFIYGALIGAGFNWFEAPLHVAQAYAEQGVAPYSLQLGVRYALFGLGGHAMFTGLFGLFLGLAVQSRSIWLRVLGPIFGLLLAIAGHMLNNALPLFAALAAASEGHPMGPEMERETAANLGFLDAFLSGSLLQLTTFLPFLLILVIALWRSGQWERRVIREELASEVGHSVSSSEYQAVLADRTFRTRRIDGLRPHHSAALVNAQHELAFRKRRVRNQGENPDHDRLVAGWRRDIERLRAS